MAKSVNEFGGESVRDGGILIFGGTFNPVHIGHLRLAVEAWECLGDLVGQVHFMPAFRQPLKRAEGILPFDFRVRLLNSVLRDLPGFYCCEVEKLRSGPSYTYETLRAYPETGDKSQRYFLLGSQDYENLEKWHKGLELPDTANLVVAPRGDFDAEKFLACTEKFWKDQIDQLEQGDQKGGRRGIRVTLQNGTCIYYLDLPRLEISATAIRNAWLAGSSIKWLTPDSVIQLMDENRDLVRKEWQEGEC